MRSDTPRPGTPIDEQLRALGRQLDEAAPPVQPDELSEATPTAEVAHLVSVDPDATRVIPLLPIPGPVEAPDPRRRRIRVLGAAAAAAVVLTAGGIAVALSSDDDEVRTDQAAELEPVSEPAQTPTADPGVELGGFGEVAEAFATCMEGAGFTVEAPGSAGFEGFEALAAMVADPAFFESMRECTASSGLADLDVGVELDELDIEGTLEEQFGAGFDESFEGMFDDVFAELDDLDMGEVSAQFDEWLAEMGAEAPSFGDELAEHGAAADRFVACMEDRGWSLSEPPALDDPAAHEQLFADLQECTDLG
jgi:hypothetical protein